jgi:hypothetical protein
MYGMSFRSWYLYLISVAPQKFSVLGCCNPECQLRRLRLIRMLPTDEIHMYIASSIKEAYDIRNDRLCDLVVRVLGYRSGGPGSIPGTTRKCSGSGTGITQPREYN